MSNNKTPYQKLKHFMDLLESRLLHDGFNSIQLARRTEKVKSWDWSSSTRKAVDHDMVRLYVHESDANKKGDDQMSHMTMAISFDYEALEEPQIRFSYSVAKSSKDIHYSQAFNVESTRAILKHSLNENPEKYGESFIEVLKSAFIDGELNELLGIDVSANHQAFHEEKIAFESLIEPKILEIEEIANGYKPAKQVISDNNARILDELKSTPEYAEVERLESLLSEAKAKLKKVKDQKVSEDKELLEANELRLKVVGSVSLDNRAAIALKSIIALTEVEDGTKADARSSLIHKAYQRLKGAIVLTATHKADTYYLDRAYRDFREK